MLNSLPPVFFISTFRFSLFCIFLFLVKLHFIFRFLVRFLATASNSRGCCHLSSEEVNDHLLCFAKQIHVKILITPCRILLSQFKWPTPIISKISLATKHGYKNAEQKIRLYHCASGDLHSNASVDGSKINISFKILEHHDKFDQEVLAILCHELGHWKQMHIYLTIAIDVVYMAILGFFFNLCLNNPAMLINFSFIQNSLFISIYLFFKVYSVTVDYPLRILFNFYYQWSETRAD